ncbi:MAG: 2-succinyl-5-enolpyruvyl-6-hydroxy-3-cyclohexene-1-carboxylic-acid synthase [Gemmatimonadota bacterium]|nr:2-succinyl-5-enolpyruvyl-6-hydroxy-3-cyclohexene-1-carboxylic-acid synthase [Gemmatimonadota bacterium]
MNDPAVTTVWARAFIDELARQGVEHASLAPGSRSTPLVMACARDKRIRTWVHLDERCAGFFALGIGRSSGRPSAVITTSGTATANILPAVVEASHAGVPMVVLTADRPPELRGTDANQTIDQRAIYGSFVRENLDAGMPSAEALRGVRTLACRAMASTLTPRPGPVHVNLPFEKPLEPTELSAEDEAKLRKMDPLGLDGRADGLPLSAVDWQPTRVPTEDLKKVLGVLKGSVRGVIVAGPTREPEVVGPAIGLLARATGFPVLADPLSGARFGTYCGRQLVTTFDLFLRKSLVRRALRPDVVLRIGGPPTSASVLTYIHEYRGIPQVLIRSGPWWRDHVEAASHVIHGDVVDFLESMASSLCDPSSSEWCTRWVDLDRTARAVLTANSEEPFEGKVLAAVAGSLPPKGALFVSNSMPVRDLDAFGGGGSKAFRVFGNRGASGIDGIVSTVAGITAAVKGMEVDATGETQLPVVAVLGDVAFHHDMNGLLAVSKYQLDVLFVVINNDGGGIFHMLPIRDHEPEFTSHFAAPHGLNFTHAAEMYGIRYRYLEEASMLGEALGDLLSETGPRILEIRSDRAKNVRRRKEIEKAVCQAVVARL